MGTCLKKPEIVYPEKSWENAEIEVKSKFNEVERYESVKGGNGFPFLWKGKFLKVVMKNKRELPVSSRKKNAFLDLLNKLG